MASTTPRFGIGPGDDKTGRILKLDFKTPAYAATINLKPNASETIAVVAQLTGAATINASTAKAYAGDKLTLLFSSDATARTVTFGTGLKSSSNLALGAGKKGSATFVFDGVDWVEVGRAVIA